MWRKEKEVSVVGGFTFMSSLGDVDNIGNVWCQFGKEGDGNGCTHPATDVTHQHRVLMTKTYKTQTCQNTNHPAY